MFLWEKKKRKIYKKNYVVDIKDAQALPFY